LSAEKSSVRSSQTYNWQGPLSKANICVFGSLATGYSVTRSLYRAGARNIALVNAAINENRVDDTLTDGILLEDKEKFCQIVDVNWEINEIEKVVSQAEIVIDTLSDWQKKLVLSEDRKSVV